MSKDTNF